MFFRRKKRDREPMPDWLKWALLGFLGLALIGNLHKGAPDAPGTIHEAVHAAAENLNPTRLLNLDDYKNAIFPRYGAALRIKDIAPGTGTPAVCGQEVTIAYQTYMGEDKPVDGGQTLAFRIGEGKAAPALEQGVVGMKKGGKRSLFSPPNMAGGIGENIPANALIRFEVELLDATPGLPDAAATPYRIATVAAGNGAPILCGEAATVRVTLWSLDGKKLFSTKDLTFTPGKSEVFLGLEQGVIGMPRGEMRTLVVPPAFQKTMRGNPPGINFPLPKNQTVLVDVESLP